MTLRHSVIGIRNFEFREPEIASATQPALLRKTTVMTCAVVVATIHTISLRWFSVAVNFTGAARSNVMNASLM